MQIQFNAWGNDGKDIFVEEMAVWKRDSNWQMQSVILEIKEDVSGGAIRLQTWPEYDETIRVDDIKLETLK